MTRKTLLLVIAALALTAAACSSDDSDATTSTTGSSADGSSSGEGTDDSEMDESDEMAELTVSSTAFADAAAIPPEYTCDGADTQPALTWEHVPEGTQEIVVIVDDPDAPGGSFIHWVLWGLDPDGSIEEGVEPAGAINGVNGLGQAGWFGPCPPPGGPHNYEFQVIAVSESPDVTEGADADEVRSAITDTTLAEAALVGTYERL